MKQVSDAEIRKEVRAALKKNDQVKVVFIKAGTGKTRKMICTLRPELIPNDKKPKTEVAPNNEVQRVFDTEIGEWRSFRYDMLVSVEAYTPKTTTAKSTARRK